MIFFLIIIYTSSILSLLRRVETVGKCVPLASPSPKRKLSRILSVGIAILDVSSYVTVRAPERDLLDGREVLRRVLVSGHPICKYIPARK